MISDVLEGKIQDAYRTLRLAAEMSKTYYEKPLIITYSGGKDSDVLAQLAFECLEPSDFEILNSHTTVDAPETVYYIRERFKEWEEKGVKCTVNYPHYKDGRPMSMWSLIVDKEFPPSRIQRYCCAKLKEASTPNRFVAVGVRAEESVNRRGRETFSIRGRNKDERYHYDTAHVEEVFHESLEKTEGGGKKRIPVGLPDYQKGKRKQRFDMQSNLQIS